MTYAQKLKLLRVVKTGVTVLLFPHEQSITILATRVSSILKPVKTAMKSAVSNKSYRSLSGEA